MPSARFWASPVVGLLLAVTLAGLGGCSKSHTRFKSPGLMNESDCAACLKLALDSESPDVRREAVIQISKTSHLTKDVVVKALGEIARTDSSESVRYAAVRALARAGVPGVIDPLLAVLTAEEERGEPKAIHVGAARCAAMEGLDPLLDLGALNPTQRDTCRAAALECLAKNRVREVRLSAARLLRQFQDVQVLDALIEGLEQRDFGIVYESERSLGHLTGQRFEYDAVAWRQWRAATSEPFAEAGRRDAELYPAGKNWWKQTMDDTRQSLAGFRPK